MQTRTTNKCLLILLATMFAFNSLNFTAAANNRKPVADAAPATWTGDLSAHHERRMEL